MEKDEFDPRLSFMSTQWTLIFQAHGDRPDQAAAAQEELLRRYAGAIHRYLLGALRDPEAASELGQEFAVRFLRGDFHRADPARGRFRDFLKRALRNLMIDHHRKARRPAPMSLDRVPEPEAEPGSDAEFDRQFVESWRRELLSRAWRALEELQTRTGQPYHAVLRCRVDHPELRSPELAAKLSEGLGRPLSAVAVRRALMRSRDKFIAYLLDEVRASLRDPSATDIEEELIALNLLHYCRPSTGRAAGADSA